MSEQLEGSINERRRLFEAGEITGKVTFGPTFMSGRGVKLTAFRVELSDGRKGYGRYQDAKSVRATILPKRLKTKRRVY